MASPTGADERPVVPVGASALPAGEKEGSSGAGRSIPCSDEHDEIDLLHLHGEGVLLLSAIIEQVLQGGSRRNRQARALLIVSSELR
jgi:hypothetical protein